jgi:hypothetical protein
MVLSHLGDLVQMTGGYLFRKKHRTIFSMVLMQFGLIMIAA